VSRDHDAPPSKTRRKREAESLQALGEQLARLPKEKLDALGLPDRLREALDALGEITSHGALRRQRQFVGRLMREVDPEPLRAALEAHAQPSREAARRFRATETWRDRLLAEGRPALAAFLAQHPGADAAALEAALEAAQQGRAGAPKRLFRMLRAELDRAAGFVESPAGESLLE
jgi:ribosome-associated protein